MLVYLAKRHQAFEAETIDDARNMLAKHIVDLALLGDGTINA